MQNLVHCLLTEIFMENTIKLKAFTSLPPKLEKDSSKYMYMYEDGQPGQGHWSKMGQCKDPLKQLTVLQIRRGNRDNKGIISHISPYKINIFCDLLLLYCCFTSKVNI